MQPVIDPITGLPLRPIDIRRAIFAVLIRAEGEPMNSGQIVRALLVDERIDLGRTQAAPARQRVVDVIRQQIRAGLDWREQAKRERG